MFDEKKLDFYIKNGYNVLMRGRHGVGKTAVIKQAFERAGLNWKYFSAATMDPWVDFVGIPKEVVDEDGRSSIELIRPKNFQNDEVEAIFLDEFNRAKPKVRNAVMELIQFKSINGVPFNNLRIVWAAINPEDEEADLHYDVDELDAAQKDRFHILLDIPYEPSKAWFVKKFGKDVGGGAVEWWKGLPVEQNILVSPRRLEFALTLHGQGGDIRDVLPNKQLNLNQLRQRIVSGSITEKLKHLYDADDEECKRVFSNINFTTDAVALIVKKPKYLQRFGKFLHKDILSELLVEDDCKHTESIIKNVDADVITPILSSVVAAGTVKRAVLQNIKTFAKERGLDLTSESAFKRSIDEALSIVSEGQSDRYNGLQAVYSNFNQKAALETYHDCLRFIANMMYHCTEKSLQDSKKPFRQLGVEVIHYLETVFKNNHSSDLLTEWEVVKKEHFPKTDEARLSKIEKSLKDYLDSPPKRPLP
jgi:hypothetical protein